MLSHLCLISATAVYCLHHQHEVCCRAFVPIVLRACYTTTVQCGHRTSSSYLGAQVRPCDLKGLTIASSANRRWVPKGNLTSSLSIAFSGGPVGIITALLVAPAVIDLLGWPSVFYICGATGLAWAAYWQPTIPERPPPPLLAASSAGAASAAADQACVVISADHAGLHCPLQYWLLQVVLLHLEYRPQLILQLRVLLHCNPNT